MKSQGACRTADPISSPVNSPSDSYRGLCLISELITNHRVESPPGTTNENLAESKSVHAFK